MGVCASRPRADDGKLLEPQVARSDTLESTTPAHAEIASRFVVQLRNSPSRSPNRLNRTGPKYMPESPSEFDGVDQSSLPYRVFLRGALLGCGIVSIPMAVLMWLVISNGFLYRFYPLPSSS
jgi:hypothetical protein